MRIYLPLTLRGLRIATDAGRLEPLGGVVFAVTDELRAEYPETDDEELEYLAMTDAARASLRLIAADPGVWLRVVVAADVPAVTAASDRDRAVATVAGPVPWSDVASVHIDGADAADDVRAAAELVDAADLGDPDAEFLVGTTEDIALGWYAPGEIRYLLRDFDSDGDRTGEP